VTRPVADGLANITASADIDMKRLSTVAHTLRGSAAYVGADNTSRGCTRPGHVHDMSETCPRRRLPPLERAQHTSTSFD